MPRAHWPLSVLALALAGVAGGGLWLAGGRGGKADSTRPAIAGSPTAARNTRTAPMPPAAPGTGGWVTQGVSVEAPDVDQAPAPPAPLAGLSAAAPASAAPGLTEEAVWSHYQPTPEELAYRAYKIEQEANAELRNLLRVLDLDEAQQDQVFAALARSSTYYHPSLRPQGADGTPIGTGASPPPAPPSREPVGNLPEPAPSQPSTAPVVDPVLAVLTPEQADVYERYTSERDAFWAGVVEDIEKEINASP